MKEQVFKFFFFGRAFQKDAWFSELKSVVAFDNFFGLARIEKRNLACLLI